MCFLKSTSCVWEELRLSWGGGMWGEHLAHFSTVRAVILLSRSCGNEIKLSCHFWKLSLTHLCSQKPLKYKRLVTGHCAGWQLYSVSRGGINRWSQWRSDSCSLWNFFFVILFLSLFVFSLKLDLFLGRLHWTTTQKTSTPLKRLWMCCQTQWSGPRSSL